MSAPVRLSMLQVLLCGALIVTLSMGIRHGFGLWLAPITEERGWTRQTFAFAMAVQNLAWGIAGPVAGMLADRFGPFRVLVVGGLLYTVGAIFYALKRPNLFPGVFGFHELFHLCTMLAFACHWTAILLVAINPPVFS